MTRTSLGEKHKFKVEQDGSSQFISIFNSIGSTYTCKSAAVSIRLYEYGHEQVTKLRKKR
jgi:hypothetical protein